MADGDLKPLTFKILTPGDPEVLRARCLANEARGLYEATPTHTCVIVGSGPSAHDERLWRRLRHAPKDHLGRPMIVTVAVNGAYELFRDHDIPPMFWACCDPQDMVADFIPNDPCETTTHLLASKCPPVLFDKLAGYQTEIWRLDDDFSPMPGKLRANCAVSISLVAQSLMRLRGFHRFEHYGWDCCYGPNGEHHANVQPAPDAELTDFTIETTDGVALYTCHTNTSWLAELHDAGIQAFNLHTMGYQVVVHGTGAMAHLLKVKGLAETPDLP